MIDTAYLIDTAKNYGIVISESQAERLDAYAELLCEWNEKINLTAITEPKEIAEKHFIDSLLLLKTDIPENAALIDVGTGAGFPSLPCAVLREDIKLTLLDSLAKRIRFLDEVCAGISVKAETVHARAEEYARKQARESFDVAALPVLCEYCLPYVKPGGFFAALKGSAAEQEAAESERAVSLLGGKITEIKRFELPDGSQRGIVVIKKISHTPTKYPRQSAKIAKSPL